jgi:hypothetical protein
VHAARRFSELTGWKVLDAPPAPAPAAAREPNESAPLIASPRMPAANTFVDRLVDNPRRVAHWRTIIQVFCALLFMWIGYTAGHARLSALLSGTQATGRIVDSRKELFQGKSGSHYSYMPIVEFDAGSRMVRFQDMWGESGPLPVGLTVPVIYDAANPTNALIDHGARNWMPWMPIAAVGAFLLLVALRSWLASMQAERLEAIAKAD